MITKAAFDAMAKIVSGTKLTADQESSLFLLGLDAFATGSGTGASCTSGFSDQQQESVPEFDGPILNDQHYVFNISAPIAPNSFISLQYICEFASRLLFLCVHWAQSITAFQQLSHDIQASLIRGKAIGYA